MIKLESFDKQLIGQVAAKLDRLENQSHIKVKVFYSKEKSLKKSR